jgi:hypothetical protein
MYTVFWRSLFQYIYEIWPRSMQRKRNPSPLRRQHIPSASEARSEHHKRSPEKRPRRHPEAQAELSEQDLLRPSLWWWSSGGINVRKP